jgi:hypothetical protein
MTTRYPQHLILRLYTELKENAPLTASSHSPSSRGASIMQDALHPAKLTLSLQTSKSTQAHVPLPAILF